MGDDNITCQVKVSQCGHYCNRKDPWKNDLYSHLYPAATLWKLLYP